MACPYRTRRQGSRTNRARVDKRAGPEQQEENREGRDRRVLDSPVAGGDFWDLGLINQDNAVLFLPALKLDLRQGSFDLILVGSKRSRWLGSIRILLIAS